MINHEKLSSELYKCFSTHIKQIARDCKLPLSLQFNQLYYIPLNKVYSPMQFIIFQTPEPYLDYYIPYGEYGANARCSSHMRLTVTGERIKLENYQGEWGYPYYSHDPERTIREAEAIRMHNQQVNTILESKGFIL